MKGALWESINDFFFFSQKNGFSKKKLKKNKQKDPKISSVFLQAVFLCIGKVRKIKFLQKKPVWELIFNSFLKKDAP